jgi:biopolymer transport protein ExbB
MVKVLTAGGPMLWLILAASSAAIAVFVERVLHYHRAQINSMEFLNGVRNVLKRDNVVEALSICDATPGPVARLVRVAILNREKGREGLRSSLEEAGLTEVPPLEERLNILATIAQIAPLMGLLGTTLGMVKVFTTLQVENLFASREVLFNGIWQSLICTAAGLALAIPAYAAYNYLVTRVNNIVLEMERAATEIINIVTEPPRSDT